ncbi:unnamed protein product [Somion occarium]|uniref:Uncharacterized protein n=1 Tax=Somion occarium TaxID=3059160 RepID=A0ABP1E575_9APHY
MALTLNSAIFKELPNPSPTIYDTMSIQQELPGTFAQLPRYWSFPTILGNRFRKSFLWVAEFNHVTQINLSTEEELVRKLSCRK